MSSLKYKVWSLKLSATNACRVFFYSSSSSPVYFLNWYWRFRIIPRGKWASKPLKWRSHQFSAWGLSWLNGYSMFKMISKSLMSIRVYLLFIGWYMPRKRLIAFWRCGSVRLLAKWRLTDVISSGIEAKIPFFWFNCAWWAMEPPYWRLIASPISL